MLRSGPARPYCAASGCPSNQGGHAEGISPVQVSAYPNPKVTVVLSGDTFFLDKTDVRVMYVNSMSTSRGTTFLSDQIAASPMIYLSLVSVAGGSLSTITGNDRKGWKGTRDMLRSALAESREAMRSRLSFRKETHFGHATN